MRIVLIAVMVLALAVPVHARGRKPSGDQSQQNSAEQQKKRSQEEKDYKAAIGRIPNQKPADPWAKMR